MVSFHILGWYQTVTMMVAVIMMVINHAMLCQCPAGRHSRNSRCRSKEVGRWKVDERMTSATKKAEAETETKTKKANWRMKGDVTDRFGQSCRTSGAIGSAFESCPVF